MVLSTVRARLLEPFAVRRRYKFYRQFVKLGNLVFDVGANMGNRTRVFLALGAAVVAVEPQEACRIQLQRSFGEDVRFRLEPLALGARSGLATLSVPQIHTIASMSSTFIERTRASGRFAEYSWNCKETVTVTTLDRLIEAHGRPAFIKVDVEGYESEVLAGLTTAVRHLSFEVTPELRDESIESVRHLNSLGAYQFAFSAGESMRLGRWTDAIGAEQILMELRGNDWGDVYAGLRLPGNTGLEGSSR